MKTELQSDFSVKKQGVTDQTDILFSEFNTTEDYFVVKSKQ